VSKQRPHPYGQLSADIERWTFELAEELDIIEAMRPAEPRQGVRRVTLRHSHHAPGGKGRSPAGGAEKNRP
jgi:hypothetical protein